MPAYFLGTVGESHPIAKRANRLPSQAKNKEAAANFLRWKEKRTCLFSEKLVVFLSTAQYVGKRSMISSFSIMLSNPGGMGETGEGPMLSAFLSIYTDSLVGVV